jgi:DNA primase
VTRIPDEYIRQLLASVDLPAIIGRDIKLSRSSGRLIGLCPFHRESSPSFVVYDDGHFHCYGCGAHGNAIRYVVLTRRLDFRRAVAELAAGTIGLLSPEESERVETERRRKKEERERRHRAMAREIWNFSRPIGTTPGEGYFRGRGIVIPLPMTLRFHDGVLHVEEKTEVERRLPAVICAVQAPDGAVSAIHRVYLDPATISRGVPGKTTLRPDKALLGTVSGGAIRFARAGSRMLTCEGPETGLSLLQAQSDRAVWCGIDVGHMAAIAWPDIVDNLLVAADRDPISTRPGPMQGKRPGEHWARITAERFVTSRPDRAAAIAVPPGEKADFNDLLVGKAAA